MDELLERIAYSLESELESEKGRTSSMDEQVALMEKSPGWRQSTWAVRTEGRAGTGSRAFHRAEGKEEHGDTRKASDPPNRFLHLHSRKKNGVCHLLEEGGGGFNGGGKEEADRNTKPAGGGGESEREGEEVSGARAIYNAGCRHLLEEERGFNTAAD